MGIVQSLWFIHATQTILNVVRRMKLKVLLARMECVLLDKDSILQLKSIWI